jgi:hypothetical protein
MKIRTYLWLHLDHHIITISTLIVLRFCIEHYLRDWYASSQQNFKNSSYISEMVGLKLKTFCSHLNYVSIFCDILQYESTTSVQSPIQAFLLHIKVSTINCNNIL